MKGVLRLGNTLQSSTMIQKALSPIGTSNTPKRILEGLRHNPLKRRKRAVERSGRERIRTSEGVRQQIYSLPPLATWVHARIVSSRATSPRLREETL